MKNLKTFEGWFTSKKKNLEEIKTEEQRIKNEEILKEIHKMSLDTDVFEPGETWLSQGDLLPEENKNDEIITNWNGISLAFDVVTKEYILSLPPKIKNTFKDDIEEYITMNFILKQSHQTESYTRTIKFKFK